MTIEWVDEIPSRAGGSGRSANPVYAEIAEALTGNPGTNARVFVNVDTSAKAHFRKKKLTEKGLVATTRSNGDGTFDVYAKFDGEPVAKAPSKPRAARKPAAVKVANPAGKKPAAPRKPRAKAVTPPVEPTE